MKRFKVRTSNLTCIFPVTVWTWPLKNFSKGAVKLRNFWALSANSYSSLGVDMHCHERLLVNSASVGESRWTDCRTQQVVLVSANWPQSTGKSTVASDHTRRTSPVLRRATRNPNVKCRDRRPSVTSVCYTFLPARRYASAGLCDSDVSVCPSVRPSVCHTPVLCLAERKQDREMYTIW